MVITADCGIGSAAEVAAASEAGIEAIVTDHHEPPARGLPGCPIVHPVVSGYPFSALCAAGVAHKLSTALREAAGTGSRHGRGGATRPPTSSTWWRSRPSPTWSR